MRKKLNKKEVEETLNKIFGVDVKWSKFSESELIQLLTVLSNPDALIKRLGGIPKSELREEARKDIVRSFLETWEGPVASVLREILGYEKEKKDEKRS